MRRAKEMAAEAADKIKLTPAQVAIEVIVNQYFKEIQESLKEAQQAKPAVEQVQTIFKEADDRWVGFCNRLEKTFPQINLDREAFIDWSNGELQTVDVILAPVVKTIPDRAHFCRKDPKTGASYWFEDRPKLVEGYWVLDNPGWYQCASFNPEFLTGDDR